MTVNPKRDAQKVEEAGLGSEAQATPPVAKQDAPGEEGIETARGAELEAKKAKEPFRPRQDSLDRERASGEGMTAPLSDR